MTITIKPQASLDEWQIEVINSIEPFSTDGVYRVSRGHSSPLGQLQTITQYAKAVGGILDRYPEYDVNDVDSKIEVTPNWVLYKWQRVWSELLRRFTLSHGVDGAKINPPRDAVCLFDYIRDDGTNMRGKIIHASPHVSALDTDPHVKPCPIDFSHYVDGTWDIDKVNKMVQRAKDGGCAIRNITVEHANGCVHLDLMERPV